jgi:3-mercaptopyruvate sulfurtransferase SseA
VVTRADMHSSLAEVSWAAVIDETSRSYARVFSFHGVTPGSWTKPYCRCHPRSSIVVLLLGDMGMTNG